MATDEDPAITAEDKDLTLTVITELEDKTALEDIRDVKGYSNKTPAAVRHFNNFLVLYCQEKNAPIVTANVVLISKQAPQVDIPGRLNVTP